MEKREKLEEAAAQGKAADVEHILKHMKLEEWNTPDEQGWTALHSAAQAGKGWSSFFGVN